MNTETVDRILKSLPATKRFYRGCFAADQIPTCNNFPCSVVVNLDTSEHKGSHWVALFMENSQQIIYFDSLCLPPFGNILEYLGKFKNITKNSKIYQSYFSNVCGFYCIFIIYHLSVNYSFEKTLKLLENFSTPDLAVKKFVLNLLK